MRYTIDIHRYDYFAGASKHEYRSYTNLLEFWSEYKRISANDYNYDDAWQNTTYFVTHDDTVVLKPQRHHARTKHEWEKLQHLYEDYPQFRHIKASELLDVVVDDMLKPKCEDEWFSFDFDDEPILI